MKKTKEMDTEEVSLTGLWKSVTLEDQNIDIHLGVLSIFTNQSGGYQNQEVVGPYQIINAQVRTMIWNLS